MSTFYLPGSGGVPDERRPDIAYPCAWTYTLIGRSRGALRAAVRDVLGDRDHELVPANTSPGGTWRSMRVELVVRDEPDRLRLFESFASDARVRFVL